MRKIANFVKPPVGARLLRGHPLAPDRLACLFNEKGGRTVYDYARNNHGVFSGIAPNELYWEPTGLRGNSPLGAANDCRVRFPEDPTRGLSKITMVTWVYFLNGDTGHGFGGAAIDGSNHTTTLRARDWNALTMRVNGVEAETTLIVPQYTADYLWAAGTYDGTTVAAYLNGKQNGTTATTSGTIGIGTPAPFDLMQNSSIDITSLNGQMFLFYIYSRVLSEGELRQLMVAPYSMFAGPTPRRYARISTSLVPVLSTVTPASALEGTAASMTLTGARFVIGATTVAVSGTGVTVSGVSVSSTSALTATFTVATGATAGARTVTVTTANGTSGTQPFTVVARMDLTANLANHWPFDEASGSALDLPGTADLALMSPLGTPSPQAPIDGTPARTFVHTGSNTGVSFQSAADAITYSADQAFTYLFRFKVVTDHGYTPILASDSASATALFLSFEPGSPATTGFYLSTLDAGGVPRSVGTAGQGLDITDNTVWVVAIGHDPVANKIWIRVNNNARVETSVTTGTYAGAGQVLIVGNDFIGTSGASEIDGAGGPLSYWTRSLSDAELDYWITVKGNYADIGGVTAPAAVETVQLFLRGLL